MERAVRDSRPRERSAIIARLFHAARPCAAFDHGGRMRRWIGNLAVLAVSLLVGLALIEGALRLLGFTPTFMIQDRTIGSRWRPGAWYRWTIEGFSEGRMNSAGWRDREYAEAKPPGTT